MHVLYAMIFLLAGAQEDISTLAADPTFYYSTLEFIETPLSPIRGSVALSKEEAMQRNHYRLTYDSKQRLQSIAFYNGPTPREPNHTANHFMLAHRMEFRYTTDEESIRFYNTAQKACSVLGKCAVMQYQLDDLGRRSALYFLDERGNRITNSWKIYQYHWSYQDDGSVIEDRFDQNEENVRIRPSFEFYRLRLTFDYLGHIALMQNIDQEGNLVENSTGAAQDRIRTNAQGHLLSWTVLDKTGAPEKGNGPDVAMGLQSINEYGYEVGLENQDEKGQAIFNKYGICKSQTAYDQFGNLAERWFYDENGEATVHQQAGYHHLKIEWDATGNRRTRLAYFAVDGQASIHRTRGFHSVSYEYDQLGRMIKLSYHTTEGHLVNRKDNGRAYTLFDYDANDQRMARHFDQEGARK